MNALRLFNWMLLALCLLTICSFAEPPTSYVNPFIGTSGNGGTFPGAVAPFGMLQWSPDTPDTRNYDYGVHYIEGFSLTHFSGAGCSLLKDMPIMPGVETPNAPPNNNSSSYVSHFSHQNESAGPGWYTVKLDNGVIVELAATKHSGFGKFSYGNANKTILYIDTGQNPRRIEDANTTIDAGARVVTGWIESPGYFCGRPAPRKLYFAFRFDRPFINYGVWEGNTLGPNKTNAAGASSGVYLEFDPNVSKVVNMKAGISYVSVDNAINNIKSENPGWDIDAVRDETNRTWNDFLGKIQVSGGTEQEKTRFYTAFYHALIHPSAFSDANGQYIGFDNNIYNDTDHVHYTLFSGWDTYRSQTQLIAILFPEVASDIAQSLIDNAKQGYGGFPRWTIANSNTGVMIGDPAIPAITNYYIFGARNFDTESALEIMEFDSMPNATTGNTDYLPAKVRSRQTIYLQLGYVPSWDSQGVSKTLEYATADFAAAQYAEEMNRTDLHGIFLTRSRNWENLFNPDTGYIQPRNADGSFEIDFDPRNDTGYTEGNAAQYTWMVPFDIESLFDKMGGDDKVVSRLDNQLKDIDDIGFHNQPASITPWLYNWAGEPWKTQRTVRLIHDELYDTTESELPGGLPGNDDGGHMSSWYVWSALGLYPAIPGVAGFTVSGPVFASATIKLGNGNTLTIYAANASTDNFYVQTIALNDAPSKSLWIPWSAIKNGGSIGFNMGNAPNTSWWVSELDAPASPDPDVRGPDVIIAVMVFIVLVMAIATLVRTGRPR